MIDDAPIYYGAEPLDSPPRRGEGDDVVSDTMGSETQEKESLIPPADNTGITIVSVAT